MIIIAFFSLLLLFFYIKFKNDDYKKDIEKIQSVISSKVSSIEKLTSENYIIGNNFEKLEIFNKQTGIDILITRNNSPVYWTNNDYVSTEYINLIKTNKVLYYNNTWFFALKENYTLFDVYFFIPLKKQYSIKNKYLSDSYFPDFDLSQDYVFSNIPQENSYQITDNKNNYLFSIVPINYVLHNNFYSGLFLLCIVILFVIVIFYITTKKKYSYLVLYYLTAFFILYVFVSQFIVNNTSLKESEFFKSEIFSLNNYINSIGALITFLLCFFAISFTFRKLTIYKIKNSFVKICVSFLFYLASLYFSLLYSKSLILNSSISLIKIYTLTNFYYAILVLLLSILIIINFNWLYILYKTAKYTFKKKYFQFVIFSNVILILLAFVLKDNYSLLFLLFNVIVSILIKHNKVSFIVYTVIFLLLAVIYSLIFLKYTEQKEKNLLSLYIKTKTIERDYSFESDFINIISRISKDSVVKTLMEKEEDNRYELTKYFKINYFFKYSDLEIRILKCDKKTNLKILPSKNLLPCFEYFNNQINDLKTVKIKENLFFIQNEDGDVNYLAIFNFCNNIKKLIIEIYPQNINEKIGYHSVLYPSEGDFNREYSIAKYLNNTLIRKTGKYNFPLEIKFSKIYYEPYIFYSNNYFYSILNKSKNIIYIAVVEFHPLKIIAFTFLTLFNLLMLITFLHYIYNFICNKSLQKKGFRYKYLLSVIIILLIAYILSGLYSFYFIKQNISNINNAELNDKTNSIINFLKEKYGKISNIYTENSYTISSDLVVASNIFYTDINIYDSTGILFASSRLSLFNKGIKSTLINYDVLKQIRQNQRIIIKEQLGNLEYYSHYVSFYEKDRYKGIIQIPYFTQQEDLNNKILSVFLWLINFYFLLVVILVNISTVIVQKILFSLTTLEKYFKNIKPDLMYQPVEYKEKDEILTLVNEYNRVLKELSEKTKKLIQSERESTWRDIARQVAHEIKNPLTPMKLHIQHTLKIIQNKDFKTDDITKTLKSLLEQIDSLASIAESFSIFSKIITPYIEEIELITFLNKIIPIYNTEKEIVKISKNNINNIFIEADVQYLKQIFNNLISNAIQAIPEDREKNITISLKIVRDILIIGVSDNGIGIPEEIKDKIFTPSFSTKTSGMGLGLAITKNMVELLNGKIYFESQINIGTTFYIELKYKKVTYEN